MVDGRRFQSFSTTVKRRITQVARGALLCVVRLVRPQPVEWIKRRVAIVLLSGGAAFLGGCTAAPSADSSASDQQEVRSIDGHYRAALSALAVDNTELAKRELRLHLQENPEHSESHFLLATLLGREGDLDQAIVGYQRTVVLESNNAVARYNLGTALMLRGDPVTAAVLLEEAVVIRPGHVPTYNNLGKAYFLTGMPALATASYQEALRLDPSNAVARRNLDLLVAAAAVDASDQGPANEPAAAAPPAMPPPPAGGQGDAQAQSDADALRELARDLPHVTVERRANQLTLVGWTRGPKERHLLDTVLKSHPGVIDLTSEDADDPHRLIEIDGIIFLVAGLESESIGHNFLRHVNVASQYFAGSPTTAVDWLFSASINYQVNIANAADQRIAFLARPHLTALSGSPASFTAGGELVFRVSGDISGDIKPYPFGTTLQVTPTLLRTRGDDGIPLIRMTVKAQRRSILPLDAVEAVASDDSVAFSNLEVTSEAILALGRTLILSGLSQRESNESLSGVPVLKDIPFVQLFFSTKTTTINDLSVIVLLTPRDPAYWDEQNRKALEEFVAKRRAYMAAAKGTPEDMKQFRERYPDWHKIAPNRFASHFFLMETSDIYRAVSGVDLAHENLDLALLRKPAPQKKAD